MDLFIKPTRIEWGLAREQYEALAHALGEEGFDVAFIAPDEVEERHLLPSWDHLAPAAEAVFFYLSVRVGDEVVRVLVQQAIEHLKRKTKRKRRGVLYGPDGKVLSRFEIPLQDDDQD